MSRPGSNADASRSGQRRRVANPGDHKGRPYGTVAGANPEPPARDRRGRACPVPDQTPTRRDPANAGASRIRATTRVAPTGPSPVRIPSPRRGTVGDGLVPSRIKRRRVAIRPASARHEFGRRARLRGFLARGQSRSSSPVGSRLSGLSGSVTQFAGFALMYSIMRTSSASSRTTWSK